MKASICFNLRLIVITSNDYNDDVLITTILLQNCIKTEGGGFGRLYVLKSSIITLDSASVYTSKSYGPQRSETKVVSRVFFIVLRLDALGRRRCYLVTIIISPTHAPHHTLIVVVYVILMVVCMWGVILIDTK